VCNDIPESSESFLCTLFDINVVFFISEQIPLERGACCSIVVEALCYKLRGHGSRPNGVLGFGFKKYTELTNAQ
jgi:hypothetical protein